LVISRKQDAGLLEQLPDCGTVVVKTVPGNAEYGIGLVGRLSVDSAVRVRFVMIDDTTWKGVAVTERIARATLDHKQFWMLLALTQQYDCRGR
jgi:hypothetical protein